MFDARQQLANWAGVDLTRINGLGLDSVMKILSEIGTDLSGFANVKHFCSWLGLAPASKISGGKVLSARTKRSANRVRQALKMAAMSLSHADCALGAFYRRLCARMDKPRANTATAHKLARMVYFMLTRGEDYEAEKKSPMPAMYANTPPLIVGNTRHSPSYGCVLRLDWACFDAPLGYDQFILSLYVDEGPQRSLSETLCVRHSMSTRSMNATQDEDHRSSGQGGAAAILSRAA